MKGSEDSFQTACSNPGEFNHCACLQCPGSELIVNCCQHFSKLGQECIGNFVGKIILSTIFNFRIPMCNRAPTVSKDDGQGKQTDTEFKSPKTKAVKI